MPWKFNSNKPIYCQIVDVLVKDIVSGKYKIGEKLPSVRDLSLEAGVNPNTVQRAYMDVEQKGIIYTKRGEGRYVCEDYNIIENQGNQSLNTAIDDFVQNLRELGFSDTEILDGVKSKLERKGE